MTKIIFRAQAWRGLMAALQKRWSADTAAALKEVARLDDELRVLALDRRYARDRSWLYPGLYSYGPYFFTCPPGAIDVLFYGKLDLSDWDEDFALAGYDLDALARDAALEAEANALAWPAHEEAWTRESEGNWWKEYFHWLWLMEPFNRRRLHVWDWD